MLVSAASYCKLRVPKAAREDRLQHTSKCLLASAGESLANFPLAKASRLISPDSREGRGVETPALAAWWIKCAKLRGEREPGVLEP